MGAWFKSLPFSVMLTLSWSFGELAGYIVGEAPQPAQAPLQKSQVAR